MKSAALRRLISSPARNYTGYAIPDMLAERVGVAQQKGELGFREADARECQFRVKSDPSAGVDWLAAATCRVSVTTAE